MSAKREHLPGQAMIKATMLHAHLAWAATQLRDPVAALKPLVPETCFAAISPGLLATSWVSFRCLIEIDRAIAKAARPGREDEVYVALGLHSAVANLKGVYKSFAVEEPHRFFDQAARLHNRFQNFGRSTYEQLGPRAGRISLLEYTEYSPVFCTSALGFYRGSLETMHVPGPIAVRESACTCAGNAACVFELAW